MTTGDTCERTVWTDYAINATFDELSQPLRNAIRNVAEASYREGLRAQDENNRELEAACAALKESLRDLEKMTTLIYLDPADRSREQTHIFWKAFKIDAGRALLAELDALRSVREHAEDFSNTLHRIFGSGVPSGQVRSSSLEKMRLALAKVRKACDENG